MNHLFLNTSFLILLFLVGCQNNSYLNPAAIEDESSNTIPVAVAQNLSVTIGDTLSITLSGTDADGDALTYSVVSSPTHGVLSGSAPALTYTINQNVTDETEDSFTFKVNDSKDDSTTVTVAISISPKFQVLHSFSNATGANPSYYLGDGGLTQVGDVLYGTTSLGGTYSNGSIFKVNMDGSGYTVLHSFTDVEGAEPSAKLLLNGTTLYGSTTTMRGGGPSKIFKIETDGSGFAIIASVPAGVVYGELILLDGKLYGASTSRIFSLNTDGTGYSDVYDFDADGYGCLTYGQKLIYDSGSFYGTFSCSGGFGSIFKVTINPDGGISFSIFYDFTSIEGVHPSALLTLHNGYIYGVISYKDTNDQSALGGVYRLKLSDASFSMIKSFPESFPAPDGKVPRGGVTIFGNSIYGILSAGGSNDNGVIYSMNLDGSDYQVLYDFENSWSYGTLNSNLMVQDNYIYGLSYLGGANYSGAFFRLKK